MFLKKMVSYLILPFPVILLVLVVGVVLLWFTSRQRTGKVLVTVGACLALILSWPVTTRLLLAPLRPTMPLIDPLDAKGARWIVVLGGGFSQAPGFPATSRLSAASLERLVEGIRLYHRLPGAKLVLSGGRDSGPVALAELLAEAALSLGLPRADMVLEPRADDTQDEARLIQEIVRDDPFVLVTSVAHMRRAQRLFEHRGMKPIPAAAGVWSTGTALLPSSQSLVAADYAEHEYVGMLWSLFRGTM